MEARVSDKGRERDTNETQREKYPEKESRCRIESEEETQSERKKARFEKVSVK